MKETAAKGKRKRPLRPRGPTKPANRRRENTALLLDLADELGLIDDSLRFASDLNIVVDVFRAGTSDTSHDPMGHWISTLPRSRIAALRAVEDFRADVLAAPDALIEAARWRLQRVRHLLEALHKGGRAIASRKEA